jgi:hypothetical protein
VIVILIDMILESPGASSSTGPEIGGIETDFVEEFMGLPSERRS